MRKTQLYLDTTIISYLRQDDSPDKMRDTLKLWEAIKRGEYLICISEVTIDEVNKCYEPKKTALLQYLNDVEYKLLEINREIETVAEKFVENNILTVKSIDDCRHIAASIVSGCDIIVSWNFKHMVNYKTIQGVKLISLMTGYNDVAIYTPTMLIEGDKQ